jgi:hypothetical protein
VPYPSFRRLAPFVVAAVLVAVAAAQAAAAGSASPDTAAAALIERIIRAYGGQSKLDAVRAYRLEGRIVAVMQGREGPTVRLFARPNRLRVELHYANAPEMRILRGAQGWRGTPGAVEPASGPMLDAMVLQAARAGVPWILMERRNDTHVIDPLDLRGRRLLGLEITLAPGLTLRVYVNPATNHVEMSQGILERGPMRTAFETMYEDFRSVDGVLFAFREENYASGQHTGYTAIEKVEWNPKLQDTDFAPPGKPRT